MTTPERYPADPDPGAWGLPSASDLEGLAPSAPGLSADDRGGTRDPEGGHPPFRAIRPPSVPDTFPSTESPAPGPDPRGRGYLPGLPDRELPLAQVPFGADPRDAGSLQGLPDRELPLAQVPFGADPRDAGSLQGLPDREFPLAQVPFGADPRDAGSLLGLPDLELTRAPSRPETCLPGSGGQPPTLTPLAVRPVEPPAPAALPRGLSAGSPAIASWASGSSDATDGDGAWLPGTCPAAPHVPLGGAPALHWQAGPSSGASWIPGFLTDGGAPDARRAASAGETDPPLSVPAVQRGVPGAGSAGVAVPDACPGPAAGAPVPSSRLSAPASFSTGVPWIPSSLGLENLAGGTSAQLPQAGEVPGDLRAGELLKLVGIVTPEGGPSASPEVVPLGTPERPARPPEEPDAAAGAVPPASGGAAGPPARESRARSGGGARGGSPWRDVPAVTAVTPVPASLAPARGAAGSGERAAPPLPPGFPAVRPVPYVGNVPVEALRADFPILSEKVEGGRDLVWFDNAATTQKPRAMTDRLVRYYHCENSNVHRGAHALAARATDAYERARSKAARFIGARGPGNIVFTRGTTEAVNLVASSFVKPRLNPGDELVVSELEHHANIVPWQVLAQETGALLRVIPTDASGQILFGEYLGLLGPRTRFVSVTHVSNALGTVVPVAAVAAAARARGVPVMVDGAQSVSHMPVDVAALGVDFFVFSGHKIYGPTGIGVLYGTDEALAESRPYQTGGNMIADVTFERTLYQPPPQRFEAGTANIAGAVGLGAALDYVSRLGIHNVAAYEESLLRYATALLEGIPGVAIVGTAACKASVLSFTVRGRATEAVGSILSSHGIAVRAGHHCAQPIVRRFGLEGTVRASLAFYNTPDEVDFFASVVREIASGTRPD